ncbi:hypothetical protein FD46_GL001675 [Liquorilactobacillus oeni DSM 19972]|uniref:RNA polymerase sigma-70 region 2 domain-containing protein n=2 Tax=Liquorilactobacillus oeni TaxID=303241 RepID=A0A0R1M8N2_9LACO|nr:hypothetical protein FD46_GL001675 [Liquorilactobacillus oeni DSM 19972]
MLADDNMRLIHGVLKSLHISPARNDYEDLLQEGCLIFADAYRRFYQLQPNSSSAEFGKFAFRRIRWRLLDLLRQQKLHELPCLQLENSSSDFNTLDPADPSTLFLAEDIAAVSFFQELWKQCTPKERCYLQSRLHGQNLAAFSREYGVSRQTVYKWRKSVMDKANKILE